MTHDETAKMVHDSALPPEWHETALQLIARAVTSALVTLRPPMQSQQQPLSALTFAQFSRINLARCLRWHPQGIKSWSLSDWTVAMVGEAGEAANVVKKMNRVRDALIGNKWSESTDYNLRTMFGKELADTVIYCDLAAQAADLALGELVVEKFNEVSIRNGFPERL